MYYYYNLPCVITVKITMNRDNILYTHIHIIQFIVHYTVYINIVDATLCVSLYTDRHTLIYCNTLNSHKLTKTQQAHTKCDYDAAITNKPNNKK